jgi:hypothetical protein
MTDRVCALVAQSSRRLGRLGRLRPHTWCFLHACTFTGAWQNVGALVAQYMTSACYDCACSTPALPCMSLVSDLLLYLYDAFEVL